MENNKLIIFLGDSNTAGDGVIYPDFALDILGREWVEKVDELMYKFCDHANNPERVIYSQQDHEEFSSYMNEYIELVLLKTPEDKYTFEGFSQLWTNVIKEQYGCEVVNLGKSGGAHDCYAMALILWLSNNDFKDKDVCVIANYGMMGRHTLVSKNRWPDLIPLGTDPKNTNSVINSNFISITPNFSSEFDSFVVAYDQLDAQEWEFCYSLKLLETICDAHGFSFAWNGPIGDDYVQRRRSGLVLNSKLDVIKSLDYLNLGIPVDRHIVNIESRFKDIMTFGHHANKENLKLSKSYLAPCKHFSSIGQIAIGNEYAKLLKNNENFFWQKKG